MTDNALRMGRRMLTVYKDVDPVIKAAAQVLNSTCRRGCSHCCQQLVFVTLPEALAIVEYLETPPWPMERARIAFEAARSLDVLKDPDLTSRRYFDRQIPCVFLARNGECRVYDVRPSPCRLLHAVTPPERCAHGAPNPEVVRLDARAFESAIWEAALHTMQQAGLRVLMVGPLQIAIRWAWAIKLNGIPAFVEWIKQGDGVMHPGYWVRDSALLREIGDTRTVKTLDEYLRSQ